MTFYYEGLPLGEMEASLTGHGIGPLGAQRQWYEGHMI